MVEMSADKEIVNRISLWSIWQTGNFSIDVERIRGYAVEMTIRVKQQRLDFDGNTHSSDAAQWLHRIYAHCLPACIGVPRLWASGAHH